jgi:four helix bundle protein
MAQKGRPRSFVEWVEEVAPSLKRDPLWNFQVYPKALFLYDLAWKDCEYLMKDLRGRAVAHQLIRSVGSICANIEEGYGRGQGREYSYFLRVAIGSARESRGWYWRGRHLLPQDVLDHRIGLLDEIIAMLAPNIRRQRELGRKRGR